MAQSRVLLDTTALLDRLINTEEHRRAVLEWVVQRALLEHIRVQLQLHLLVIVQSVPREHIRAALVLHQIVLVNCALEEILLLLRVQPHLLHVQPALLENMLQQVQVHVYHVQLDTFQRNMHSHRRILVYHALLDQLPR